MHIAPTSAASRGRRRDRVERRDPEVRVRGQASTSSRSGSIAISARGRLRRHARRTAARAPRTASAPGVDGASSIGSVPDWVLGKAMTSRMFVWPASSAAQRSMPSAIPPCGGAPYSKASRTAPNLLAHPLERLALEQEAALEQVAPMDPDRPAAELPAVEREVVLERAGPAGRIVRRRSGRDRPTPSTSSVLVLGQRRR